MLLVEQAVYSIFQSTQLIELKARNSPINGLHFVSEFVVVSLIFRCSLHCLHALVSHLGDLFKILVFEGFKFSDLPRKDGHGENEIFAMDFSPLLFHIFDHLHLGHGVKGLSIELFYHILIGFSSRSSLFFFGFRLASSIPAHRWILRQPWFFVRR